MGLLQKAVETYDAHVSLVGQYRADHSPLAPIGHITTNAAIEITLDEKGNLLNAVPVEKKDAEIIIPATEKSAGRTSGIAPHPLCEQIGYLSGKKGTKFDPYVEQLESWANSAFTHPMLPPILNYVKKKTILDDLKKHKINLSKDDKDDKDGKKDKGDDKLVRWRVEGIGEESGPCWENQHLFSCFTAWYQNMQHATAAQGLCMITGKVDTLAGQHHHLRGIIPAYGSAKLISANDNANFTYRGRFTDDSQAATISYTASQKAHNALKWLVSEQSVTHAYDGRTFLCWNPKGKAVPHAALPFKTRTESCTTPSDYRRELQRTLNGYCSELPATEGVVIAAFDATSPKSGRLSLTYYNELPGSDFLQRLHDWDTRCCWWGWNPDSRKYNAIASPSLLQIVNCAFGTERVEKGIAKLSADDRIVRQQMQRLITCRIDRALFPADIERALVNRASMPQAYEDSVYNRLLITACAVIRKYHHDHMKEDLAMSLEPERKDRSYQFGRLLAVLEKAERDTFDAAENREPNAIRLQSAYCQRPLHTANLIESQLERAYFPKLRPGMRIKYKRLIGEIMERICAAPEHEWNKPLGDTYLIGYYLQRNDLYQSNAKKEADPEQEEG